MFTQENMEPIDNAYGNWKYSFLTTAMFRETIKRLQAYGLVSLLIET
jgi:hypothetical protein